LKHPRSLAWFANSVQVPSRLDLDPDAGVPGWVRLQALAGALPLAGYLVLHLASQAFVLGGAQPYEGLMRAIDRLPWLLALEVVVIYLPLSVHVGAGLGRVWMGRSDVGAAAGGLPVRGLQVASGAVLLAFLAFHFWQFRWRLWVGELSRDDFYPELCASLSTTVLGGVPLVALGYLVGVSAAAIHGAQGLYRVGISYGIGRRRRPLLARLCAALGLALFVLGALIVIDLATGSVLIHWPG